jgi:hypothetical protein
MPRANKTYRFVCYPSFSVFFFSFNHTACIYGCIFGIHYLDNWWLLISVVFIWISPSLAFSLLMVVLTPHAWFLSRRTHASCKQDLQICIYSSFSVWFFFSVFTIQRAHTDGSFGIHYLGNWWLLVSGFVFLLLLFLCWYGRVLYGS